VSEPEVKIERRPDGTVILSAGRPLPDDPPLVIDRLREAAERRPDTTFLAERRGPQRAWQRLTYAEAWAKTGAVASWLIAQGYGPESPPAAILSDNSLENALFLFGALRAGVLVAPISPAWSLAGAKGGDFERFDHAMKVVQPSLVFAQDSQAYSAALDRAAAHGARIVTIDGKRGFAFGALATCSIDAAVAERRQHITRDTPAKILFTSGSTGLPRGVLTTHGNLAAALEMTRPESELVDTADGPVTLDWLPWHHTAGGNTSLNGTVRAMGTLHIDGGRPLPGRFDETIANLRELPVTYFGSVPASFPPLLDALERDLDLRRKFFRSVRALGYGGASLAQESFDRLQTLSVAERGERLPFGSGWGMTETTGIGLSVSGTVERMGLLGLPLPGFVIKLVPADDRYELRVKGPNVTPGYYNDPCRQRVGLRRGRLPAHRRCGPLDRRRCAASGPRLRRPPRRGIQARLGDVGARHRRARGAARGVAAGCARAGDRGARQGLARRADMARSRLRRCARGACGQARRVQCACHRSRERLQHAHPAPAAARGTTVGASRRDHRQKHDQHAPRARTARVGRRAPLRRSTRSCGHPARRGLTSFHRLERLGFRWHRHFSAFVPRVPVVPFVPVVPAVPLVPRFPCG
jgi:feruloyl-CoA synthase